MQPKSWLIVIFFVLATVSGCRQPEDYRAGIVFTNQHPEEKIESETFLPYNYLDSALTTQTKVARKLSEFLEEGLRNVVEVKTFYSDGYLYKAVVYWSVYPVGEGKSLRFKLLTHRFEHEKMLEDGLKVADATVEKDMRNFTTTSGTKSVIPIKFKGYRVSAEAWTY